MKKRFLPFVLLAGIMFTGCSKKEGADPQPFVNPIPSNTASVQIDGVVFPMVPRNTGAVLNPNDGSLLVVVGSSDVRGPSVSFILKEFRKRAEKFQLGATSKSTIVVVGEYLNSPDGQYSTDRCTSSTRSFEITEFNEKTRTVSGLFSGTVCSTNGKVKIISEGKFNLPYIVQ